MLCLGLCLSSWEAAAEDDVTELKRAIELVQAQNREMARRLAALEAERAERKQAGRLEPAPKRTRSELAQKAPRTEPPRTSDNAADQRAKTEGGETLEERVKQLELAKPAQEEAVRSIIQSTFSTRG